MTAEYTAAELGAHALGLIPVDAQRAAGAPDVAAAIARWKAVLGREHVLCDEGARADFSRTTLPRGTTPAAVLRPGDTRAVQQVVRIANQYGASLHAISRGKNWGYGDACAPADGRVIVDLRRLNGIRELNAELGYAIIEPGVSQGQLYEHLRDNRLPLLLDVTGAGPDASIVGNILQRGFGHTPYGDRFRHTSGFEVVLRDGRLVRTGFGRQGEGEVANVFPWGSGPWVDGLFTQSDLGIVTAACVWLMPKPEVIEGFAMRLADDAPLGALVDALRRLRMAGVVRSTVHVANDLRVLSTRMARPTEGVAADRPLPTEVRARLRRQAGVGAWNVLGALYGSEGEVRAQRREVRRALRAVAPVRFFRRTTIERARAAARLTRRVGWGPSLAALVDSVSAAFDLLEGKPNAEHLAGARWRAGGDATAGGDLRDVGLIWVSPVIPMTAEHSKRFLATIEPVYEKHGFDLLATLTAVTDRAMCCVLSVNYDKQDADQTRRALACAAELKSHTSQAGYPSYRNASVPLCAPRA